ncbi:MAG: tRNA epoxyqueuosine(34) reductase QueG [Candidatus Eisenbacteria bacterium]
MNEPTDWKTWVRERALALGFSSVGFAGPNVPDGSREHLLEWLARGYHADMGWMARDPDARVDPARILPGCRSVVVVTAQYNHPDPVPLAPGLPRVSRYAWGDDYHEVMGERLRALRDALLTARPGTLVRIACDTSPVAEKAFAVAAGVGWLGKNACVIDARQGSWFFLGELFTDLDLAPDPPVRDLCGSCRACLDACPTEALVAPYLLDATRCISYLTIEHRGPFEEERGRAIDDWLVGCDICQDVCPWNRKAPTSLEERFRPRPELAARTAEAWSNDDDLSIRARLKGTAVTRIKPADLRRNASHVRANLEARRAREEAEAGELRLEPPLAPGYFSDAGGKDS